VGGGEAPTRKIGDDFIGKISEDDLVGPAASLEPLLSERGGRSRAKMMKVEAQTCVKDSSGKIFKINKLGQSSL
jgi:hypothetical protein